LAAEPENGPGTPQELPPEIFGPCPSERGPLQTILSQWELFCLGNIAACSQQHAQLIAVGAVVMRDDKLTGMPILNGGCNFLFA